MKSKETKGHLSASLTILIWGTTFISTKLLLQEFRPIEILFIRFILGFLMLIIACPRVLHIKDKKQEMTFALAGLCGVCLYYLLENIALTYTLAANVGVIISVAPFFTAITSHFVTKEEPFKVNFFAGFVVAMAGIACISFSGNQSMEINPCGDVLALIAAFIWAIYSVLTRKIVQYGYNTIQSTRKVFAYGLIFMLPAIFFLGYDVQIRQFANPTVVFNMLYLGVWASALCFVTWNTAVKLLGAVKTSIYIYMVPVITVVTSVIVLHEKITAMSAIGTVLTLVGLFISEHKSKVTNTR